MDMIFFRNPSFCIFFKYLNYRNVFLENIFGPTLHPRFESTGLFPANQISYKNPAHHRLNFASLYQYITLSLLHTHSHNRYITLSLLHTFIYMVNSCDLLPAWFIFLTKYGFLRKHTL